MLKQDSHADVLIVGAGAAGLAAARHLRRRGRRIIILEARSRIGGRILTHHPPSLPLPVELGAEFLHGETPETDKILAEARLAAVEVPSNRWRMKDGTLRPMENFDERLTRVFHRIDSTKRKSDESFAEALRKTKSLRPADKKSHGNS